MNTSFLLSKKLGTLLLTGALIFMGSGLSAFALSPARYPKIDITSSAFTDGAAIPERYVTVSPPLAWSNAPAKISKKIKSYAVLVVDRHPVAENWVHLAAVNINRVEMNLREGQLSLGAATENLIDETGKAWLEGQMMAQTLKNSFGNFGYEGPRPPAGSGPHTYEFIIFGLKKKSYRIPASLKNAAVSEAALLKLIGKDIVVKGVLRGTFEVSEMPGTSVQQNVPQDSLEMPQPSPSPMAPNNIIEITANGFQPAVLTIKAGESVKFTNTDSRVHWPASNKHPTHTDYPGGNFDARNVLKTGETFEFTFTEKGSWRYHDHLSPGIGGTIVVE